MVDITITEEIREHLGNFYHDSSYIDIKLKDGRVLRSVSVRERLAIVGYAYNDIDSDFDFIIEDIVEVRPASSFPMSLFRKYHKIVSPPVLLRRMKVPMDGGGKDEQTKGMV